MSRRSKLYTAATGLAALAVLAYSASTWQCADPVRYFCYLLIALAAAALRLSIPGITGSVTVNYLFVLIGVVELSFGECVLLAGLSAASERLWRRGKPGTLWQSIFNASVLTVSGAAAWLAYHWQRTPQRGVMTPVSLIGASLIFFVVNTMAAAGLYAVEQKLSFWKAWKERHVASLLHYGIAGCAVALIAWLNRAFGWEVALLILPVVLERMESERKHSGDMSALHLRTVQTLALAIEAKDENTAGHLERVRVYAVELGRHLGLGRQELSALEAASILHDIGKLAVPEHIISKPGRLTHEEFDRMKMHPVIGAQILSQVGFPFPVVPIVRSHHERWDGTGYPDGLSGERIPIGARILSAVDCLDALASERQYRRALPLDEAMDTVEQQSGKSFDPLVVAALKERYRELEAQVRQSCQQTAERLSALDVTNAAQPLAGLAKGDATAQAPPAFLGSIASARQEAQMLFELTQELGNSLSLHETLSVLSFRLKRLVPYESIAIYLKRGEILFPEFVAGEEFRLFSSLEIPLGEGLSGWALANRRTVLNSDPSLEAAYLNDPAKRSALKSALVVPLDAVEGSGGALALYAAGPDAFTRDHLRILSAVSSKAALAIENALKYQRAESIAMVDPLTGLLNARALFLQLDAEIARARRSGAMLSVVAGDLDGFRQVNSRFGQQTGDRALQEVARSLKQVCREYDHLARMSADEFVMVLPGVTPAGLEPLLARVEEAVSAAGSRVYPGRPLTVAFGRAIFPQDGTEAEQLLAVADRNLYRSKRGLEDASLPVPPAAVASQSALTY